MAALSVENLVGGVYRMGRKLGAGSFGDIYLGEAPWLAPLPDGASPRVPANP